MSNSNNRADRHKADTEQAQFWQMAVETHQDSGLSVRAFCRQEGLSEPSFYAWRKKLARNDEPPKDGHAGNHKPPKDRPNAGDQSPFIEVSMPQDQPVSLELVLCSGHRLRIAAGTDTHTLHNVIAVLRQAGLC